MYDYFFSRYYLMAKNRYINYNSTKQTSFNSSAKMPELCSEEVNHFYHLIRACLHVPKKLPEKDFNYYYHKNTNHVTNIVIKYNGTSQ